MALTEEWERIRPTLWGPSRPLGEALEPSKNSFGFLRLAFAFAVLVDHAFPLGGFLESKNLVNRLANQQQTLAGFAVAGFFVISGYLVTRSYTQSRTAVRYFWKRVLRIFPAFLVCLVLTASVFGLLAYHRQYGGFSGYLSLSPDSPWGYIYRNMFLTMHQWNIGNLLQATPFQHNAAGLPQAFNGSLWTVKERGGRKTGIMTMRLMPDDDSGLRGVKVSVRPECFSGGIEQIDWQRVKWFNSNQRFKPDFGKSLQHHGLSHKSLIRFRTPALNGIAREIQPGQQAF